MASSGDCTNGICSQDLLHYVPSLAGNVTLLALFAILIPLAFVLGLKYHSLVFSTTVITGLFLEVVGYVGRVLLACNDSGFKVDFILSYLGTILAPSIICLAIFRLMPPIVAVYGEAFQAWRPAWHNLVFYALTAVCIVLEAAGGILSTVPTDTNLINIGIRLLVAGLAIQVSSLLIFACLGLRFAHAVHQRRGGLESSSIVVYNTFRFKVFLVGLSLATVLLVARTVYRMVVAAEGFSSPIAQNEAVFLVLDGVLVLTAVTLILAMFPRRMLGPPSWSPTSPRHHRIPQKTEPLQRLERPERPERPERTYRPAPIHLKHASYAPSHNRVSLKSNSTSSPKNSPKRLNTTQRNMVDSDNLW